MTKRLRTAGLESWGFTGTAHTWSLRSCLTLCDPMDCSPSGSSVHGDSPGKNTGVGCHALLQGILLTERSNLHLLQKSPALAGGFFTTSATEETPCGPKKEPQKETKLRRFRDCGLQVEVEGWAGQAKAVSSRGQRKQWARRGMHDWRPWAATGRSRKGWEACDPCQGGKEWATKSLGCILSL